MSLASDLIAECAYVLNDAAHTTWTNAELLAWLNQGVVEVVNARPDAGLVIDDAYALDAGYAQALPAGWLSLTEMPGVTRLDYTEVQMMNPAWRDTAATVDPTGYFYDPRQPKRFEVFPPNDGTGTVDIRGTLAPILLTAVGDAFPLDEAYRPAVVSFMLFRAFSKDYEGNLPSKAAGYYEAFKASIGLKSQADSLAGSAE